MSVAVEKHKLADVGNLSSFATLITIIVAAISASHKLDSLDAKTSANCRAINGGIILTLEGSRAEAEKRGNGANLNRIIDQFNKISESC